jgi:phosphonoacetaldehyde hydrolase
MGRYTGKIKLVVLDIAGVLCDGPGDLSRLYPGDDCLGCKASVIAFVETFKRHNINVKWSTVRESMGLYKKDQLRALLKKDYIAKQFRKEFDRDWTEEDVNILFQEYKQIVDDVVIRPELTKLIAGAKECVERLRAAGVIVGCDSGHTRSAAEAVIKAMEKQGLMLDVYTNTEEVIAGRPHPWMIFRLMEKAKVYPPEAVVKVDDTVNGIYEGKNAGAWTIGVYATGNDSFEKLAEANPDFLVPSIREVPDAVLLYIQRKLLNGELPGKEPGYER